MTAKTKTKIKKRLPVRVSLKDFNRHIKPHLRVPVKGPEAKISTYKIFNYILEVLYTGTQWRQLKTYKNEYYWSSVYKWHNRWSKDGSYQRLFENSIITLDKLGKLDLTILHGDGSNVVAKKGEKKSDTRDTNIKKERKCFV
ncbi:MAG: transposase [Parcubacteria group bacterium]|jgi:transposase